jgi:hypothetical protein
MIFVYFHGGAWKARYKSANTINYTIWVPMGQDDSTGFRIIFK